jgi:hypothetical protein
MISQKIMEQAIQVKPGEFLKKLVTAMGATGVVSCTYPFTLSSYLSNSDAKLMISQEITITNYTCEARKLHNHQTSVRAIALTTFVAHPARAHSTGCELSISQYN